MKYRILFSLGILLSIQPRAHANLLGDFINLLSWNYQPAPSAPPQIPTGEYNMTLSQARSYVAQYLASIDHGLRPYAYENDMKWLKDQVYTAIKKSSFVYKWIGNHKWYSQDKINQIVLSNLLDLIKNNTYSYALEQSNNRTVSQKIASSIRNNALAIVQKTVTVEIQSLRPFFGESLKQYIRNELLHFDMPYQHDFGAAYNEEQSHAMQYYPSEACCVCFEKIDTVKRVFLKPCGHDMCKICALEWFYEYNADKTKTCPLCRSWVNLDQLTIDLDI